MARTLAQLSAQRKARRATPAAPTRTARRPDDMGYDEADMASDAPEDGGRAPHRDPESSSSAAFAATVAPQTTARLGPPVLPVHTGPLRTRTAALDSETTLDAPAAADLPQLPVVSAAHYRADREIARGGMGRIVAAEDQRLGRRVALKELLEPAPEQLGRFHREALITARLQHPGIVPVYEAGCWPSGEPFFAMKLVSGRPLDRVIAEAKTLEARLALLPRITAATDAIAFAHSQRVIHRDLKPANILIGDFGETVVIDWGLAKHLDDADGPAPGPRAAVRTQVADPTGETASSRAGETAPASPASPASGTSPAPSIGARRSSDRSASTLTVAGAVMGTPAYMAPEQARGEPVDQRADVFALGAMLYHLLAGAPPYNARTATDVIAAAAHSRVVPLGVRERGAPPDLVAIVERAMSPLPIDRYADAGELASELRRFLTGQLVSAHRYTTAERIGRFVRRHRGAVMIAVLAAIAFAAGGTFAVRRIMHERDAADRERRLADTRSKAAEHLIDRMLSDVRTRLQQIGRIDLLASLGTEIRDYYGTLATIPGGMPPDDIDRMVAATELIGLAERDAGRLDEAFAAWTDARATLAAAIATSTGDRARRARGMLARLDFQLGTVHQQRGKIDAAVAAYTQAKQAFVALRAELPADRDVLLGAADAHDRLGDLKRNGGQVDEAFAEYSEAKASRELAASSPNSRPQDELLALSTSHLKLGSVFQARGESAKALESYRACQRLRQTLLEGQRDNVELQNKLLEVELTLGDLQRAVGDPASAIATYRKALPVMDTLTRRDPANTTWRRLRGNLEADFGFALLDNGEYKEAARQLEVAITTQRDLVERDPQSTIWQGDLSRSYTRAGDAQTYLGEVDHGIALYRRALEIRRDLVAHDPKSAPYRRSMAWSHAKLARAHVARRDLPRAIEAHEAALALRARLVEESPGHGGYRNELASSELALGRLIASSDPARSRQLIEAGLVRARALVERDPINHEWKETLIHGLLADAETARAATATPAMPAPPATKRREAALAEALVIARAVTAASSNVHWPGLLAEVHAGLAELAAARGDALAAAAAWQAVRDTLEPLARAGRLSAQRTALLDRARGGR
jgi:serine/threonine protein kinase/tetratricopeptide (TPR) repeat protein